MASTRDKDSEKKGEEPVIDITTTDDKKDGQKNDENVALSMPGTHSTYQRVEKGTRTALLYWDGWLTAKDAKLAEDDPDYYTKSNIKIPAGVPKRNMNLPKNWTYTKQGEVQYISTGFAGIFDKGGKDGLGGGGKASNNSSAYGSVLDKHFGGGGGRLDKQTGPVVGTIWDLRGNAKDRSAYADVVPSKGAKGGSDDRDFYRKSGTSSRGGTGSAYMSVGGGGGGGYSSRSGVTGGAGGGGLGRSGGGTSSGYMDVQTAGGSCWGGILGGKDGGHKSSHPKIGYGTKLDKATGKYSIIENDDYKGAYGANGAPYRQNWKYGDNKEVVYIQTNFIGIFDRKKIFGDGADKSGYGAPGGGGNSQYGTASERNQAWGASGAGGAKGGPSVGSHWNLKGSAKDRSAYADVKADGVKGANNNDDGYYSRTSGKQKHGSHRSVGGSGAVGGGGGGRAGPGSAYLDVNPGGAVGYNVREHHPKPHHLLAGKGKKNDSVYMSAPGAPKKEG